MLNVELTNAEKNRIDQIYGNSMLESDSMEGLTADDLKLIIKWERALAAEQAVNEARNTEMFAILKAEREKTEAEAEASALKLSQLVEQAKARYNEVSGDGI